MIPQEKKKLNQNKGKYFYRGIVFLSAGFAFFILLFLIGYILVQGVPHITPSLFALEYNSENASLFPALISTIIMTVFSLIITVPLGVGAAIYLVEYASKKSKLVKVIRITTETLSGIPSIVYGIFGMLFFVYYLKFGTSMIAGVLTISIMILPLIIRSTEVALLGVADTYREGSFGLGAGRLRTTVKVVLPSAINGILSGVILAIGRIVGETAALMYTSGTVAQIPGTSPGGTIITDSARTLSVHMNILSSEGFHTDEAYATAVVLLVVVLIINAFAHLVAKRLSRGGQRG